MNAQSSNKSLSTTDSSSLLASKATHQGDNHDETLLTPGERAYRSFQRFDEWFTEEMMPYIPRININPGHVFLSISLFAGYLVHSDFQKPMDSYLKELWERAPLPRPATTSIINHSEMGAAAANSNNNAAVERIPHGDMVAIANRAFRIATRANIAFFSFATAMICYASGWNSIAGALAGLEHWARPKQVNRETARSFKWVPGTNHVDFEATKGMDELQELQYLSDTYLSNNLENNEKNHAFANAEAKDHYQD